MSIQKCQWTKIKTAICTCTPQLQAHSMIRAHISVFKSGTRGANYCWASFSRAYAPKVCGGNAKWGIACLMKILLQCFSMFQEFRRVWVKEYIFLRGLCGGCWNRTVTEKLESLLRRASGVCPCQCKCALGKISGFLSFSTSLMSVDLLGSCLMLAKNGYHWDTNHVFKRSWVTTDKKCLITNEKSVKAPWTYRTRSMERTSWLLGCETSPQLRVNSSRPSNPPVRESSAFGSRCSDHGATETVRLHKLSGQVGFCDV